MRGRVGACMVLFLARPDSRCRAGLMEFGQAVGKTYPGQAAAGVGVVLGREQRRVVEAAGGEVDQVRRVVMRKGQLGAAAGAKTTHGFRAGAELRWQALHEAQRGSRHAEPGHERRSCSAAAHRAVANRLVRNRARGFVTNGTA
ncbi:hypothetical protein THIARS_60706 [Thiomonas delicata]|uniref:Uncharacterized protein n=1 Tax=Thiomonas delicata TaxID=364030 RepID=A0A238D3X2_THIDL|nr:hypothetical protein THIARS_60706 [Thiomonas delicata]